MYVFIFSCVVYQCHAQKYILLDKAISQPAFYSNTILVSEKFKGFFPVEKKDLPKFVSALEEISRGLSSKSPIVKAKNYKIGCTEFRGVTIPLDSGERQDYVLTSTCDNIKITMHLCDAKLSNDDNAYFIDTWIKYIKKAIK